MTEHTLLPHICLLLIFSFTGLSIFSLGYFPLNLSRAPDSDTPLSPLPNPPVYERLVLIVIDALRFDFVMSPSSPMQFVREKLGNRSARCFVGHAHAPTVTLPRVKALVTGTVPAFFDMLTQISSPELQQDNLISRLRGKGKQLVFFGDDTWMKLFPRTFKRQDGTVSFFVNDYTEVDDNVTRHLPRELASRDWDLMILHYLGLDHIGHTHGSRSELIAWKLREMDEVIEKVYREVGGENSLILVLGDHGMSVSGSHGGATKDETHVPLLFLSSRFEGGRGITSVDDVILQVDVTTTLAILFGVGIPRESVGAVIPEMLSEVSEDTQVSVMKYNLAHLCRLLEQRQREMVECSNPPPRLDELIRRVRRVQSKLISSATDYDHAYLYSGLFILLLSLELSISLLVKSVLLHQHFPAHRLRNRYMVLFLATLFFSLYPPLLLPLFVFWLYQMLYHMRYYQRAFISLHTCNFWEQSLVWGTLVYPLSFLSSSCVEEEHYIWYHWLCSFHVLLLLSSLTRLSTSTLALWFSLLVLSSKLLSNLKQTGINWAHLPDVSTWLLREESEWFYLVIYSYSLFAICLVNNVFLMQRASIVNKLLLILSLLSILYFKLVIGDISMGEMLIQGSHGVREGWFILFLSALLLISYTREFNLLFGLYTTLQVVFLMLTKPYYSIILLLTLTAHATVYPYILSASTKSYSLTLFTVWLCYATHFACGNSNHFATVDLGAGFKGMAFHSEPRAAIQTYLSVFAMFLLTLAFHFAHYQSRALPPHIIWRQFHILLTFRLYTLLIYLVIMLTFRYHLFVWTVFAPKFLYEVCHSGNLLILFGIVLTLHLRDRLFNLFGYDLD